jgi:hypothetical protein
MVSINRARRGNGFIDISKTVTKEKKKEKKKENKKENKNKRIKVVKPDLKWKDLDERGISKRGYEVDKELSGKDWTVYHNPKTKKTSIKYRGTDVTNWRDLSTDALIAMGLQGVGSRFRRAEKVYDRTVSKYGGKKEDVNVYGHSLGGTLALHVNQTRGAKANAYNPGSGPLEPIKNLYNAGAAALGNKKAKRRIRNQRKAYIERNVGDPLSLFSGLGLNYRVKTNASLPFSHGQKTL